MKSWYASKTLWINAIAAIALMIQGETGFIIDPQAQAALLVLVNMILRLVTGQPIKWGDPGETTVGGPGGNSGFATTPLLIGLALICLFLGACATTNPSVPSAKDTPLQTAGKSLLAVKSAIVTSATTADSLCKTKLLPADKCSMAKQTYEMSKPAYDSAVDAYLLLSQGGDPAAFAASLQRLQDIANNMLLLAGGTPSPYPSPLGPDGSTGRGDSMRPTSPAGKDQ